MNIQNFKCVVIDDDRYAIEGLAAYIKAVPNLSLLKSYENPVEALMDISKIGPVDLILLDIHMPQITGIQLSREIRSKTQKLVFTTSYTQYGYDAFEVEADGYLLKPFSLQKFTATVSKVMANALPNFGFRNVQEYFFVKIKSESHKMIKVWTRDIVVVEAQQNYIKIHTSSVNIVTYMSLTEIMRYLYDYPDLVQFQRSFIIAQSRIESIVGNRIKMDNGLEFVVGSKFRENFQEFIKNKLLKAGS